ncbi:polysaccharide deacetylase family protein [Granulosicoccus antarcticus]|uniref:NodB homology domain-containing protein n=1 Tax=Granulosicoccus antarcticus IMCC3135 TaxID=1192854 RepID=A0A2Z2P190_9GAMM|nr:polysaccharide deacetylase family protein [Granulosicoccus antarcticus]ASJ74970.1 hypothetical protein IMCC3135_24515 [Granulosicoccus antarcticus IMCC3135]
MSVVLMYHALYRGEDTTAIDQEDLPYAVSEANFIAQLDLLKAKNVGLFDSDSSVPDIIITFDDGHQSNLDIAAPLLQARGMSAYFFITSNFIDQRSGFMSGEQLRRLAQMPGMSIGSHGVTHQFFDDLTVDESRTELVDSRTHLELLTGMSCQSISFPGGRYNEQTLDLLKAAGYRQWFGSEIGTVSEALCFNSPETPSVDIDEQTLLVQQQQNPISRVAVRRNTTLEEFERMTRPDESYFRRHRRRGQIKLLVRRLLGNRLYHGLYKILSAR